ncbi:NUDIX domain-containing protein [Candidatus Mycosynbacter amalyticus]|uniref:NUDIX domain-containing protein n=1 Tax=Candidatus Mycosynbacter amalyticus TaxID=2665156 RepID=A0A857MKF2_9BACT|nr:NUDIX domain-containing protein [Candidatus Mycosynbacter amalyticus]QHN42618.1 NUDIX domain-containing protein [Candidatus Mycosynbacter amalyticus]
MSDIRRDIISRLKQADTLRYAKLKPDAEIPNDLYNYHLRKLVSDGIVEKTHQGYTLSEQGRRHVADTHHTSDQGDRLFKYNVLLVVAREIDGILHILNQRRTAQPSYGIVGIPGGTILKSEPLLEGAARKLMQETGLTGTFRYIGTERRIFYRDAQLFSDVLFPFCLCTDASGEPTSTEFGDNFWVPIDEALANDSRPNDHIDFIPKTLAALRDDTLETLQGFYHEQIAR